MWNLKAWALNLIFPLQSIFSPVYDFLPKKLCNSEKKNKKIQDVLVEYAELNKTGNFMCNS